MPTCRSMEVERFAEDLRQHQYGQLTNKPQINRRLNMQRQTYQSEVNNSVSLETKMVTI